MDRVYVHAVLRKPAGATAASDGSKTPAEAQTVTSGAPAVVHPGGVAAAAVEPTLTLAATTVEPPVNIPALANANGQGDGSAAATCS